MAALEWDKTGERFFEKGIDHGVLYPRDGLAVPWNGLTDVTENTTSEVKSYWMDGIKYLDHHVPGSYSAKLEALTYPDELEDLMGNERFAPGVYLHDQKARVFHLSYRTGVGNDVDAGLGYKIHIIYNVMALPAGAGYSTASDKVDPAKMSWDLTGTPPLMFGARPTAHISLHSIGMDPELLESIENQLYGTAETDPALPSMVDLMALVEGA